MLCFWVFFFLPNCCGGDCFTSGWEQSYSTGGRVGKMFSFRWRGLDLSFGLFVIRL